MAERNSHVINWDDAMEQCGDDEEFLRELLVDLKGEVEQQLDKIEDNIKVRVFYSCFVFAFMPTHQ